MHDKDEIAELIAWYVMLIIFILMKIFFVSVDAPSVLVGILCLFALLRVIMIHKSIHDRSAESKKAPISRSIKTVASITSDFQRELSSIPKVDIETSDQKIKGNAVKNMPPLFISRQFSMNFVVIDVETTGLKVTDSIIEIAAIRFENGKPKEAFTTLLNPGKPIPPEATAINHITNDMVGDAPDFKSIVPALENFVGNSNLLGQNLKFDLKFLYKNGYDYTKQNRKYYDTLEMAKEKLTKYDRRKPYDYEYDVDDYKLDTLCECYSIYRPDAHRALSDCLATGKLFLRMVEEEY